MPHEVRAVCQKLRGACSGWKFRKCGQLPDFGKNSQVRLIDWMHLFQSLQEVALVRASPDSSLELLLEKFVFPRLLDERESSLDVTIMLTSEE